MSLVKTYTFEVTPKHPARKMYDKLLFPDGFAYVKEMSGRQALANFPIASTIKVEHENKWYKVTPADIEKVLELVDANTVPGPEVQPGARSIASYIHALEKSTELELGEWVSGKLADLKIEIGNVTGEFYKVENFTEFSGDVKEQNGFYFPFGWTTNTDFTTPKMRVVNGFHPNSKIAMDPINVIYLGDSFEQGHYKIIEITATDKNSKEVKMSMVVSNVRFLDKPSSYSAPAADPGDDDEPAG